MKMKIFMLTLLLTVGICSGCGREETEGNGKVAVIEVLSIEEAETVSKDDSNAGWNENLEIDFTFDFSEDIKADVDYMVSASASLQEELENIERIIQKYTPMAQSAQSQMEMNISSKWFFVIWDTELNHLWNRFNNSADQKTKEKLLAEQRNWIAMKEEVMLLSLGPAEENGSMYPLLQNSFLEEITKNRAYILANELAKIKGEAFTMPELSEKYGLYVDNQGTGDVYSFLITRQGWEENDEAVISIYRLAQTEGSFTDNGNEELVFISDDGSVEGIIRIDGWNGASFEITQIQGETPFTVGEVFEFPFVF